MKFKITSIVLIALAVSASAIEPKEDPNAVPGPGFFGAGGGVGPDAFGYTGDDSNGGNCSTQFIDISATGTSIANGDDVSGATTLGAPFDFYGTMYTDLVGASNGYISTDLTDTGPDLSNDCPLPASPSTGGGARIYPVHDDLISEVFYEYFDACPRPSDNYPASGTGCHVFQWNSDHFGGGGPFSFEAILYNFSWEIVFVQGSGNPEMGSGSTTGIQNDGASIGLTYACDTAASIPDNSAQCFVHPNPNEAALAPPVIPVNNKYALMALVVLMGGVAFFLFRRRLQA